MAPRRSVTAKPNGDLAVQDRWTGESIRLSFFYVHTDVDPVPLWRLLTGSPPEAVNERPAQGVKQAQGPFGPGQLTVSRQPTRLDIVLGPTPRPATMVPDSPFVDIGPRLESQKLLVHSRLDMKVLSLGCIRIAYAVIAFVPGKGVADSNKILSDYVKNFSFEPETDSEIFLQINRPVSSSVLPEIKINRVTKWQVAELQLLQFTPEMSAPSTLNQASMCRLECDLSTDPRKAINLPGSEMTKILEEMIDLTNDIFKLGDAS